MRDHLTVGSHDAQLDRACCVEVLLAAGTCTGGIKQTEDKTCPVCGLKGDARQRPEEAYGVLLTVRGTVIAEPNSDMGVYVEISGVQHLIGDFI